MKTLRRTLTAAVLLLGAPTLAHAQAGALIEKARAQLEDVRNDSARVLVEAALRLPTSRAERTRAFTLLGFAQLGLKNRNAARQAFEQALRLEPTLRIDSLDLDADAPEVFAQARTAAATQVASAPEARQVLLLTVMMPPDTIVSAADPRLPFIVQPNGVARTVSTITATGSAVPVWSDTQTTLGRHRIAWPLRRPDGTLWPEGQYQLRAQATDSNGQATKFEERTVLLSRIAVDTQVHPAPLAATAFAPEGLPPAGYTGPKLLMGSAMALLVALTPTVFASQDLNAGVGSDPTSYAVAGGVALASVVGFVKGRRGHPLTANIQKNAALREDDQRQRTAIINANAEKIRLAPIRVTVQTP